MSARNESGEANWYVIVPPGDGVSRGAIKGTETADNSHLVPANRRNASKSGHRLRPAIRRPGKGRIIAV